MNIFELFSNAKVNGCPINSDKDVMDSSELMGIGLAYCHAILKKMDSVLKLTSTVDIGSTFNFNLNAKYLTVEESQKEIPGNVSIPDADVLVGSFKDLSSNKQEKVNEILFNCI